MRWPKSFALVVLGWYLNTVALSVATVVGREIHWTGWVLVILVGCGLLLIKLAEGASYRAQRDEMIRQQTLAEVRGWLEKAPIPSSLKNGRKD